MVLVDLCLPLTIPFTLIFGGNYYFHYLIVETNIGSLVSKTEINFWGKLSNMTLSFIIRSNIFRHNEYVFFTV